MAYVMIHNTARTIDTDAQVLTARFELAVTGQATAEVYAGKPVGLAASRLSVLHSATTLEELLELLRDAKAEAPEVVESCDLSNLPTFGGEWPADTSEVWSWDADRLLVGTCIADMHIVDREESEGGAQ